MSVGYPNGGGGFLWAGRPNNGLERDAPATHLICAHRRLPFFTSAACPPACAFAVDDVGEIFRHAEHALAHAGNVRAAMADLDTWLG
jgi:hypothetical protein